MHASLQPDVDELERVWLETVPAVDAIVENQVPYRRSATNVVTIGDTVAEIRQLMEAAADRLSQRGDTQSAFLAAAQLARLEELRNRARNLIGVGTDPAAEAMANWVELATVRRDALAALDAVAADLNTN